MVCVMQWKVKNQKIHLRALCASLLFDWFLSWLTKDEASFLEEIIQDAYNEIHEGQIEEEEEELDENIITIYGLNRSISLTQDEI